MKNNHDKRRWVEIIEITEQSGKKEKKARSLTFVASLPTWEELKNLEISLLLFFNFERCFERCPDIVSTERAQPYKEGR